MIFVRQSLPEPFLQMGGMCGALRQLPLRHLRRHSRPHDPRHVFHPRAPAAFLVSAVEQAGQPRPAMAIEHANAFWAVKAMRRKGQQIRPQLLHIESQPSGARFRIDIERHAFFMSRVADGANRLNRPDVMVDMVNSDQNRLVSNGFPNLFRIDTPHRVHRQTRADKSLRFQKRGRIQHRRMLHPAQDQVVSPALIGPCCPLDSQVGRFRPVARKNKIFRGRGMDEGGCLGASSVHRVARAQTALMQRGGIAKMPSQEWFHGFEHFRQGRSSGLVVEIDLPHGHYSEAGPTRRGERGRLGEPFPAVLVGGHV